MKKLSLVLLALISILGLPAQEYKVTTNQEDDFSKALVQLLNAAANRFEDCTGDSIRSTWLLGDDYRLTIPFPGSTIGVVRTRDYDRNVYVEFRGYKNVAEVNKGVRTMISKLKKALGDQLVEPGISGAPNVTQFSIMSIRDKHGFFTSNIELLPGASHADPYLLGPEREEELNKPKKYFILLKVKQGIPSYQYYIKDGIIPPDEKLQAVLKRLLKEAATDFDSLPMMKSQERKPKKVDTMQINGYTIWLNKRGAHRSANIVFDVAEDSIAVNKMMTWCRQAIEAAVGSTYVYFPYSYLNVKSFIYYASYQAKGYKLNSPRIDLEYAPERYNKPIPVVIKIQGVGIHPVKRSASFDD
jgi:hypothetical protein